MSHLLPLSRVVKLVGRPRHALQEMIRGGTLSTFDGMVELDELLRAFPEVEWADDAEFRRVTEIKDKAFAKRVRERALPDKDVLVARLNELGDEYAAAKALLLHYGNVMAWLDEEIDELEENPSVEAALRNGGALSYGCSNGNCGECKAHVVSGEVKKVHAHDYVLKQTEKDAGVILLCAYAPVNDMVIEANVADAHDIPVQPLSASAKSVEVLNPQLAA